MTVGASRFGVIALFVVAASAATALGMWGTHWTISQAPSSPAGYKLEATWDGDGIPGGPLDRPIGVAVAHSGEVYVTDARLRVIRFSAAGEFLAEWGREGDGPGEFRNPVGVAVSSDGFVYVSDYELDRIQKFTSSGEFVLAFGRSGSGPGEFNAPAGLTVDDAGRLYVTDFYNHRVQAFRPDSSFDSVLGHPGRLGPGALHYPTGVAVTPAGSVLVADAYNYQIQWFGRDGNPRSRAGYHLLWLWPRPAKSRAGFFVPSAVGTGGGSVVHVADSGNHRVVMLSADGEYLTEYRVEATDVDVFSPAHLAVSQDGAIVYAADLARDRLLVLRVTPPAA